MGLVRMWVDAPHTLRPFPIDHTALLLTASKVHVEEKNYLRVRSAIKEKKADLEKYFNIRRKRMWELRLPVPILSQIPIMTQLT